MAAIRPPCPAEMIEVPDFVKSASTTKAYTPSREPVTLGKDHTPAPSRAIPIRVQDVPAPGAPGSAFNPIVVPRPEQRRDVDAAVPTIEVPEHLMPAAQVDQPDTKAAEREHEPSQAQRVYARFPELDPKNRENVEGRRRPEAGLER